MCVILVCSSTSCVVPYLHNEPVLEVDRRSEFLQNYVPIFSPYYLTIPSGQLN